MSLVKVPEIVGHRSLRVALAVVRMEVAARQEEVSDLAARSTILADDMAHLVEQLASLDVDGYTVGNVSGLADMVGHQAGAAMQYKTAADQATAQADTAARTAMRNHGGIAQAVDDAPVRMAKPVFYTE